MIKTIFLTPVRDNENMPFTFEDWEELDRQILASFGAYSMEPGVSGVWQAPDGKVYRDVSNRYTVSLTSWRQLPVWLDLIFWVRERFRQEAIYTEIAGIPEIM